MTSAGLGVRGWHRLPKGSGALKTSAISYVLHFSLVLLSYLNDFTVSFCKKIVNFLLVFIGLILSRIVFAGDQCESIKKSDPG